MEDFVTQFGQRSQIKIDVIYGSSGNLFSQIVNGAPFDLFFSADLQYPRKLATAGLAQPGSLLRYAVGQIVLWAPGDSNLDPAQRQWGVLLDREVKRIAVASPEHAPYGRAAIAALQKAGVYGEVREKLVYGENISQAAQFVQSGNAQLGIIAKSLALSPAMAGGKAWDIPASLFPPIEQAAVILKTSSNQKDTRAFLEFVRSSEGQAILAKHGFALPADSHPGK
jgi:molybdate transport system substrate-binding protein